MLHRRSIQPPGLLLGRRAVLRRKASLLQLARRLNSAILDMGGRSFEGPPPLFASFRNYSL
jgi:hypothetical protein